MDVRRSMNPSCDEAVKQCFRFRWIVDHTRLFNFLCEPWGKIHHPSPLLTKLAIMAFKARVGRVCGMYMHSQIMFTVRAKYSSRQYKVLLSTLHPPWQQSMHCSGKEILQLGTSTIIDDGATHILSAGQTLVATKSSLPQETKTHSFIPTFSEGSCALKLRRISRL